MSIKRTLRYHWLKFLRLQDDPRKLAWGMALGIFIGITPTIPFHFVSILFLAPPQNFPGHRLSGHTDL